MSHPAVSITPLEGGAALRPCPDLGDPEKEALVSRLLSAMGAEPDSKSFLLLWEGSKIPRGAVVCGWEITWTQHGSVQARHPTRGSANIGVYERLEEWGGPNGNRHQMVVNIYPSCTLGPPT